MANMNRQSVVIGLCLVAAIAVIGGVIAYNGGNDNEAQAQRVKSRLKLADIPFDGAQSMKFLENICAIGGRVSGTPGMAKQQELLKRHFTELGGKVSLQSFRVRHPETGFPVTLANMIVEWHPERQERILLCAHYDTRPFPDRDRQNPRGIFIGANDGASGVAVLAVLGQQMADLRGKYGVDFVLFDGEELVYDSNRDEYFLGSRYFATEYKNNPPRHRYKYAVLLDMVGDAELHLYQEKHSVRWRDTRPLTFSIWRKAKELGVREFIPRSRHEVRDDHLMLHDIAKIPTCDIIDFDYPRPGRLSYWHTQQDTPDKCSALSLAKVGWVVSEWLKSVE
ncbi:MAG: M28 family peptidase [Pirellulaceae bacterium]|jgi:hypothetical protein|nr:M28 family peptidase [Pirellulaceae bacterium]MDP7015883.1 M28 family peptidase [Pirellulaceae bacterium]